MRGRGGRRGGGGGGGGGEEEGEEEEKEGRPGRLCSWDTHLPSFRGLCSPTASWELAGGSSGLAFLEAAPEPWGTCRTTSREEWG